MAFCDRLLLLSMFLKTYPYCSMSKLSIVKLSVVWVYTTFCLSIKQLVGFLAIVNNTFMYKFSCYSLFDETWCSYFPLICIVSLIILGGLKFCLDFTKDSFYWMLTSHSQNMLHTFLFLCIAHVFLLETRHFIF